MIQKSFILDVCQSPKYAYDQYDQNQPTEAFYKKGVLKNLTKFAGEAPVPEPFFNKTAD